MEKNMNLREQIFLLEKFNEGCELTDAVQSLLNAAYTLNGINMTSEAGTIVEMVKDIIADYTEYLFDECSEEAYKYYSEIDDNVYYFIFGNSKVTKEEFLDRI